MTPLCEALIYPSLFVLTSFPIRFVFNISFISGAWRRLADFNGVNNEANYLTSLTVTISDFTFTSGENGKESGTITNLSIQDLTQATAVAFSLGKEEKNV